MLLSLFPTLLKIPPLEATNGPGLLFYSPFKASTICPVPGSGSPARPPSCQPHTGSRSLTTRTSVHEAEDLDSSFFSEAGRTFPSKHDPGLRLRCHPVPLLNANQHECVPVLDDSDLRAFIGFSGLGGWNRVSARLFII